MVKLFNTIRVIQQTIQSSTHKIFMGVKVLQF